MGELVPVAVIDALPGDTFVHSSNFLIRMSPMLAPVMHPIVCRIHHWFVPYRLLWDEFEDFITGGSSGLGVDTPDFPVISSSVPEGSLLDYLGLPVLDSPIEFSALPIRAYNLIYNNFYRDQDLQPELSISYSSGVDSVTSTEMMNVCWQKDYFTTSRPWTQKGSDITVPVYPSRVSSPSYASYVLKVVYYGEYYNMDKCGLSAAAYAAFTPDFLKLKVAGKSVGDALDLSGFPTLSRNIGVEDEQCSSGSVYSASIVSITDFQGVPAQVVSISTDNRQTFTIIYNYTLSSDQNISVLDLRKALALQRFEEKRANYGSRYVEYLLAAFGVRPRDARLQLPEYLGGGKQLLRINEVLQTAQGTDPVGTLRGQGTGLLGSNRYKKFIPEHGVILSLLSILPETMYTQGIKRMWLKRTPTDFFMREYASVGVQEVYTQELYGASASGKIFGYQDRYDEYRYEQSSVSGEFRNTLDFWNLSRRFGNEPVLNASFVECNPTKRIFASQATDTLWCLCNHSIRARRVVPRRAITNIK